MPLKQQINRSRHLLTCPSFDRVGAQVTAFTIHQRDQIATQAMDGITFPIAQPLAGFSFGWSFGYRLPITQLPATVVASVAFPIALTAVSQIPIERAAGTFVGGNKPINPLMANCMFRLFLLQSLSNLLRAHAVF